MLKKLRHKKTSKKIFILLAIIIIPAFAFWGFSSLMRGPKEPTDAGRIMGKNISLLDFKEAADAVKNMAIMQYGENYSKEFNAQNLEAQAWDRLILLAEAQKRRINIGDKEVIDFIQAYPFFQNKGSFDNRMYTETLNYVFHTQPRTFEEQTRQNLEIAKLYKELTANLNLSDQDIRQEYEKLNREISLNMIIASPADFSKDVPLEEKTIKDYYSKNSFQFKQPLSFNVAYVSLNKEDPAVSEEKVKALFSHLKAGKDFAQTAKSEGLTVKETGLFKENDPIPGIGWSPEISLLIAKTKQGQLLKPILLEKIYYILKLTERKEPFVPEYAAIKEKVKEAYIKDQTTQIAKNKITSCYEETEKISQNNPSQTLNFDELAKRFALKASSTNLFKFGSYIEGVGASDIFWTKAQSLKDNQTSGIIETPSGFYLIKIKSRVPIDEKKFSAEKDTFSQSLLLQKKQEDFANFLEGLKKKGLRF